MEKSELHESLLEKGLISVYHPVKVEGEEEGE